MAPLPLLSHPNPAAGWAPDVASVMVVRFTIDLAWAEHKFLFDSIATPMDAGWLTSCHI